MSASPNPVHYHIVYESDGDKQKTIEIADDSNQIALRAFYKANPQYEFCSAKFFGEFDHIVGSALLTTTFYCDTDVDCESEFCPPNSDGTLPVRKESMAVWDDACTPAVQFESWDGVLPIVNFVD